MDQDLLRRDEMWVTERGKIIPKAGSPAHVELVNCFALVADCAKDIQAEAENKLEQLRIGTYDVWKPDGSTTSSEITL
jgi:hypothetical protein